MKNLNPADCVETEYLSFSEDDVYSFCKAVIDENPEHKPTSERLLIPTLLLLGRAFGKVKTTTYLVEHTMRCSEKVYIDEEICVKRTLTRQKKIKTGIYRYIDIQVYADNKLKHQGQIKILVVE